MNNQIQVYAKSKTHFGNLAIAVCFSYGNHSISRPALIDEEQTDGRYYSSNVILKVMAYLYRYYRNHDLHVLITHQNMVTIINRLPYWNEQNWAVSEKDSNDMYKEAKQQNRAVQFIKIPSNYTSQIQNYKRILHGKMFFSNGLSFGRVSSNTLPMRRLSAFLNQRVGSLAPTQGFQKHRKETKNNRIIIQLEPQLKAKFISICQKMHVDYKQFLYDSMKNFVKVHQVSTTQKTKSTKKLASKIKKLNKKKKSTQKSERHNNKKKNS